MSTCVRSPTGSRPPEIRARILAIGRPIRVELVLDGRWLERLKAVLRAMDSTGGSYPLHRYLQELIEADIVYREGVRSRGPFLPRQEILRWLQQRHAGATNRKAVVGNHKGR